MTAAFGDLIGPTVRGRAGRVACVLAFALPVPLCAALGLSLPLPTSVERLAAKLVPFATSPDTRAGAARGSIALAAHERPRAGVDAVATTAAVVPDARVRRGTRARGNRLIDLPSVTAAPALDSEAMEQTAATPPTADRTASPVASPEQPASNTPITSAPNTSTAAPPPAATGGGTESGGGGSETPTAPAPTPPSVVETATNTASGAVTTVTNTTQPVAETTKETVDSTVNTAKGVVGGLKPP
jgi:hypothetical protein